MICWRSYLRSSLRPSSATGARSMSYIAHPCGGERLSSYCTQPDLALFPRSPYLLALVKEGLRMSETATLTAEPRKAAGFLRGWVKTIIGTFAGLMSGAVVMWFSPLLDKFVK